MEVRPDEKLSEFAANLWRPIDAEPDPAFPPPTVSADGGVVLQVQPPRGPESDEERFHATIAQAAKPSRWFNGDQEQYKPKLFVTKTGKLLGPVGYGFSFVSSADQADGVTRFAVPWEVA